MERRFFPLETVGHNGAPAPGQVIRCGKCDATDHVNQAHGRRPLPPEAAANMFRHRGWFVGKTDRKDRCPACNGTAKKPTTEEISMGLHNENTVVELKAPKPGASEAPPREMTREDRRIVFVKLEEVYVDEATGYTAGWNDTAVARDLNCPRAWVEVIREENFGPQKAEQSAEVIELRERIAAFEHEQTQLVLGAARLKTEAEKLAAQAADMVGQSRRHSELVKGVQDALAKMVGGR